MTTYKTLLYTQTKPSFTHLSRKYPDRWQNYVWDFLRWTKYSAAALFNIITSAKPAILDRQLLFTLGRTCLVMLAGRNSQSMFASVCLGKRRMPRKFGAQVKQFPRCLGTPWIIHSFGSKLSETATCFPPVGDLTEPGVLLETRVQEKLGVKWHTYDKTGFLGENVITLILRWKVNGPYDSFMVNF